MDRQEHALLYRGILALHNPGRPCFKHVGTIGKDKANSWVELQDCWDLSKLYEVGKQPRTAGHQGHRQETS